KRQASPAGKPQSKIAGLIVASQEEEQHQQNDKRRGVEKGDAEKALMLQHDVSPPGAKCRLPCCSCQRILSGKGKSPERHLYFDATRCLLTGQDRPNLAVPSHIMPRG